MQCHKAMATTTIFFSATTIIILHRLCLSRKKITKKPLRMRVFRPTDVIEANEICASLRLGSICIVDVTDAKHETAQRIVDYLSGMAIAFNGKVKRLSDKIFIMYKTTSLLYASPCR